MKQKKLMLLGGLRYLLPIIEEAHKLGVYVITADYLPDNIAHKFSDEYCNVSIIDKEAVLARARELPIDGILSHAVDPGVTTAAYVAEQMGLPFQCSYEAACILQDKSRFRQFLMENGFNCPKAKGYINVEDALKDVDYFTWPVIVKPVDSAGSKGVTKVERPTDLKQAIDKALESSISKHFIIEDFLEKDGYSAGSESFVVDGKLVYNGFYDQHFDDEAANPYTPSAEIWPSVMAPKYQEEIKSELQRLIDLLHISTGIFNVECRVCKNGKAYLMEVSPRGGGNRLCEMLRYATGVDMITAITRAMVGDEPEPIEHPVPEPAEGYNGHWAEIILHADNDGEFVGLQIDPSLPAEVVEEDLWVKPGDKVHGFEAANDAIGTLVLRFENGEELEKAITNQSQWLKVIVNKQDNCMNISRNCKMGGIFPLPIDLITERRAA